MTRHDALRLRAIDSEIDGHPNPAEGFPFFPAATGSLGQGLSIANGLALAARLDGVDKRIFCLIGDGESREGQIWEAVDFLVDYRLHAVCPIFNCNNYGQAGMVSPQQAPETTAAKLRAAGLDVQLIDGHNPIEIQQALPSIAPMRRIPRAGRLLLWPRQSKAGALSLWWARMPMAGL
jgi:transketolase